MGDAIVTKTCTDLGLTVGGCEKLYPGGKLFMTERGFFTKTVYDSMRESISESENPQIEACTMVQRSSATQTSAQICQGLLQNGHGPVLETVAYSDFQKILDATTTPGGASSLTLDRIIAFSEITKTQVSRIVDALRSCPTVANKYQQDDSWLGFNGTKPNPKKWAYKDKPASLVPPELQPQALKQSLNPPDGWKNVGTTKDPQYKAPNGDVWKSVEGIKEGVSVQVWFKLGTKEYLKNKDFEKNFYPPRPSSHHVHDYVRGIAQDERTETPLELSLETFLQVRQGGERPVLIIPEVEYFEALDEPGELVLEESQPTVGLSRSISAPVGTAEDIPVGRPRSQSIGGKFKITKRRRFKTIKKTKRNNKKQTKIRRRSKK